MSTRHPAALVWGLVLLITIPTLALFATAWWLQSHFGANAVLIAFGSLILVGVFAAGALLSHRISKHTLRNLADYEQATRHNDAAQARIVSEALRLRRDENRFRWQDELAYRRDVQRLAERKAKALAAPPPQAPLEDAFWQDAGEVEVLSWQQDAP